MSLFRNKINLETGQVFSLNGRKEIGSVDNDYKACRIYDSYGNKYSHIHEVIIAEGMQLPKHLWPVDEKGRRYEVDHILSVRKGGTDEFNNLQLISKKYNNSKIGEEQTNRLNSVLNKQVYQYTLDGELVGVYTSTRQAARETGFKHTHISACCIGKKKQYKGFQWSYKPLNQ